jgi:DNA-binding response OmpR family regulator
VSGDAHILVVDDEAELRAMLQEHLLDQGFAVSTADGAASARDILAERAVDLVVLDRRMPGEDGLSLARELRVRGSVGIVMLTASAGAVDKIIGLEVGADDYLAKPFDPHELVARIRSVLRRTRPTPAVTSPAGQRAVRFGHCVLELDARRLYRLDGTEVPVTAMELELLETFARHPNRVLSRSELLNLAHTRDNEPFDRSIDIRIARLRQKIEPQPGKPRTIKTVHGVGYVFKPSTSPDVEC